MIRGRVPMSARLSAVHDGPDGCPAVPPPRALLGERFAPGGKPIFREWRAAGNATADTEVMEKRNR